MNNSTFIPLIVVLFFCVLLLTFHVASMSGKVRQAEKDISVIKTVLTIKEIMPLELAKEKK